MSSQSYGGTECGKKSLKNEAKARQPKPSSPTPSAELFTTQRLLAAQPSPAAQRLPAQLPTAQPPTAQPAAEPPTAQPAAQPAATAQRVAAELLTAGWLSQGASKSIRKRKPQPFTFS